MALAEKQLGRADVKADAAAQELVYEVLPRPFPLLEKLIGCY
jgi:hypothetical protein